MRNKQQPYIFVTIIYALLIMFILGFDGKETTQEARFLIAFLWVVIMGLTAVILNTDEF